MTTDKISLKDIWEIVNRLEDKMDKKVALVESRVDAVESKTDQIMGKIGVAVFIIGAAVSAVVSLIVDAFKKKLL